MDGYIVHSVEGFFKGAFNTFAEANAYRYHKEKELGERLLVSKERKYRQKYMYETGLANKVFEGTLAFLSR